MIKSRLSRPKVLEPRRRGKAAADHLRQAQAMRASMREGLEWKGRRLDTADWAPRLEPGTVAGLLDQRLWHPSNHSTR